MKERTKRKNPKYKKPKTKRRSKKVLLRVREETKKAGEEQRQGQDQWEIANSNDPLW